MDKANTAVTTAKQNRMKSWPMWLGILSALWLLASTLGLPQKIGLTNEAYNNIVSAIGTILALLGVVNNPTNPNGI
ncbi:MAG: phage holin [Oscillospiraceae bacterium]